MTARLAGGDTPARHICWEQCERAGDPYPDRAQLSTRCFARNTPL